MRSLPLESSMPQAEQSVAEEISGLAEYEIIARRRQGNTWLKRPPATESLIPITFHHLRAAAADITRESTLRKIRDEDSILLISCQVNLTWGCIRLPDMAKHPFGCLERKTLNDRQVNNLPLSLFRGRLTSTPQHILKHLGKCCNGVSGLGSLSVEGGRGQQPSAETLEVTKASPRTPPGTEIRHVAIQVSSRATLTPACLGAILTQPGPLASDVDAVGRQLQSSEAYRQLIVTGADGTDTLAHGPDGNLRIGEEWERDMAPQSLVYSGALIQSLTRTEHGPGHQIPSPGLDPSKARTPSRTDDGALFVPAALSKESRVQLACNCKQSNWPGMYPERDKTAKKLRFFLACSLPTWRNTPSMDVAGARPFAGLAFGRRDIDGGRRLPPALRSCALKVFDLAWVSSKSRLWRSSPRPSTGHSRQANDTGVGSHWARGRTRSGRSNRSPAGERIRFDQQPPLRASRTGMAVSDERVEFTLCTMVVVQIVEWCHANRRLLCTALLILDCSTASAIYYAHKHQFRPTQLGRLLTLFVHCPCVQQQSQDVDEGFPQEDVVNADCLRLSFRPVCVRLPRQRSTAGLGLDCPSQLEGDDGSAPLVVLSSDSGPMCHGRERALESCPPLPVAQRNLEKESGKEERPPGLQGLNGAKLPVAFTPEQQAPAEDEQGQRTCFFAEVTTQKARPGCAVPRAPKKLSPSLSPFPAGSGCSPSCTSSAPQLPQCNAGNKPPSDEFACQQRLCTGTVSLRFLHTTLPSRPPTEWCALQTITLGAVRISYGVPYVGVLYWLLTVPTNNHQKGPRRFSHLSHRATHAFSGESREFGFHLTILDDIESRVLSIRETDAHDAAPSNNTVQVGLLSLRVGEATGPFGGREIPGLRALLTMGILALTKQTHCVPAVFALSFISSLGNRPFYTNPIQQFRPSSVQGWLMPLGRQPAVRLLRDSSVSILKMASVWLQRIRVRELRNGRATSAMQYFVR
ncbi:hypothetical protein CCUS01_04988 [Colletotrichum cuscutae]|uniref:Uncharacterized protein n=1 Tax=Colletotrichum cuscutae TaxID=1209917 RepID=A0AAI9V9H6_9PEZI|nr:hypothetical protein CCUS01_04988 [Colletotrichum cuscutae]